MDNNNYQQPNYQQGNYQQGMYQNNMAQTGGNAPWFVMYLVLSIAQLICCNQITGIISLVFTLIGNSAYASGDFVKADKDRKNSRLALIIGVILSVICCVASFALGLFDVIFNG